MKLCVFVGLIFCNLCNANSQYEHHDMEGIFSPLHPPMYDVSPLVVKPGHHSHRPQMKLDYLGYSGHCGERRAGTGMPRRNNATLISCDYLYGYTGPTANDEPENIMRPCPLDDWQCVRNFFAANSNCIPVFGPIPDPLRLDVYTMNAPVANMQMTLPNMQVRGLGTAKIEEFYVNTKSKNLIIALNLPVLNQTTDPSYFRYHRIGKEPIILDGYATVQYSDTTITAIIPMQPHLRLDLADIHAYFSNGYPPLFMSPTATASTDPEVQAAVVLFLANLPTVVKEVNYTHIPLITSIYIQKNICDFGLQIVSL